LNSGNPELIHALWLVGHVRFLRGDQAGAQPFWDEALASAARTFGKDSVRFARLQKSTTNPAMRVRDVAD
jgi:hypothetical protein